MSVTPVRVLIVDDEPDFVEPVVFWLKSKGYDVVTAPDGKQALQVFKNAKPDIVFLDIQMPEMDGIETLRGIREINKRIPVIMVTAAYRDPANFELATQLGATGFFPKQDSLEKLIRLIETTVRLHSKSDSSS